MSTAVHALPENTKNQSSIDQLLSLPVTLAKRERAFEAGLGHGDVLLYNKEYLAIKAYRSKK